MDDIFIKLSEIDKPLIERVSTKLGKTFYGDYINIQSLLDLLSDLEDKYDDVCSISPREEDE